jgi:hypothetical protein
MTRLTVEELEDRSCPSQFIFTGAVNTDASLPANWQVSGHQASLAPGPGDTISLFGNVNMTLSQNMQVSVLNMAYYTGAVDLNGHNLDTGYCGVIFSGIPLSPVPPGSDVPLELAAQHVVNSSDHDATLHLFSDFHLFPGHSMLPPPPELQPPPAPTQTLPPDFTVPYPPPPALPAATSSPAQGTAIAQPLWLDLPPQPKVPQDVATQQAQVQATPPVDLYSLPTG